MSTTTLTVPAEHAEHFRAALVEEIGTCVGWVKSQREDLAEARQRNGSRVDLSRQDLLGAQQHLEWDIRLMAQIGCEDNMEPLEVRADPDTLAHVCETMADKVVGPTLNPMLDGDALDAERAAELRRLAEPLTWAAERAAEFHTAARKRDVEGA